MQERLLDYAGTVDPHSRPTAVKKLVQEVQYTPKQNPIAAGVDTLAPPEHQPSVPEYKVRLLSCPAHLNALVVGPALVKKSPSLRSLCLAASYRSDPSTRTLI